MKYLSSHYEILAAKWAICKIDDSGKSGISSQMKVEEAQMKY